MKTLKDVTVGLHKSDIKLQLGEEYIFIKMQDRKQYLGTFRGNVILETRDHITVKCKHGYCQTFLKVDILLGEYKIDKPKVIQGN